MHQYLGNSLWLGFLLVFLAGCATGGPWPVRPAATEGKPPASPPKPGDIVETRSGRIISLETLLDELTDIDVIYVGETHILKEDHRVQLEVLKGLHDRNPSLILAMEMFPRRVQPVLDRYSQGLISEAEMLEETDWTKVWGYPFRLYEGLLAFARDNHLKILALNAPPEIVRKISRSGLATLTAEERMQVAEHFLMTDPRHREYVRKEYEQHLKETIKDFATFYEAQLAWEETMAETLARNRETVGKGARILVLVGQGHIIHQLGLPQLASMRSEHGRRTIIPATPADSAEAIREKIADYIWVTREPEPHPHPRARLGVMIQPASSGEGIEIVAVLPESPAAAAGVQKGDVIYSFDGVPAGNVEELHKVLKQGGGVHRLGIKRGSETITVEVSMPR